MRRLISRVNTAPQAVTPEVKSVTPEVKTITRIGKSGIRLPSQLSAAAKPFELVNQNVNLSNTNQSIQNPLDQNAIQLSNLQRINSRFPANFDAKVDVNYDIENVGLLQPWDVNIDILDKIIEYLNANKIDAPYSFINANGGLGLMDLAFLNSDKTGEVLTFESNPKFRNFIKNNVSNSINSNRHRLVDDNRGFNGLPAKLAGWVVFFNTSFGERTGGRTPFEWLPLISNASLVAIVTPQVPQEIANTQYKTPQILELKSGNYLSLYMPIEQSKKMVGTFNRITKQPMSYKLSSARDIVEIQLFPIPAIESKETSITSDLTKNDTKKVTTTYKHIPIPILILPPNMPSVSNNNWSKSLEEYLFWIIRPIINAPVVEKMVCDKENPNGKCILNADVINVDTLLDRLIKSPSASKIWHNAFTHYSYDYDNNYEVLEYLGDRYVGAVFTSFVNDKFPNLLNPGTATHFYHMYMSGNPHANYTSQMGLDRYVRSNIPIDFKIRKNLFESFIGALWENAENIGSGYGFVLVKELLAYMFAKFVPHSDLQYGSARNQVTDIFMRLDWGRVNIETKSVDNGSNVTITLPFIALKMLASNNINASPQIANVTKSSLKTAEADVWWSALAYLRSIGVTREFVNRIKYNIDFNNSEMKAYIDDLAAYGTNKGLTGFYFEAPIKDENTGIISVILSAYQNNNRLIKFEPGTGNTNTEAKVNAVKKLLNSI